VLVLQRVTWERVEGALNKLREADKRDLTVLVVGRPGVGVSSTCNALLGQNTCRVQAFVLPHHAQSASQADLHMRQHGELLLRVVHTDRPLRQVRPTAFDCASMLRNVTYSTPHRLP
jgi:septin family protein